MRTWLKLAMLLCVCSAGATLLYAQPDPPPPPPPPDDQPAVAAPDDDHDPLPPPQERWRMPGPRKGPRMRDQGRPNDGPPGRPGQDWRNREQIDPDELIAFLQEHDPDRAKSLIATRENDPQEFRHQLWAVGRLYGPAMEQMKFDPTMGRLSVDRVQQQFKVEKALDNHRQAADDKAKEAARKDLQTALTSQFDTIIKQQELWIERGAKRAQEWSQNPDDQMNPDPAAGPQDEPNPPAGERPHRRGGRGMGRGGDGRPGPERFAERLETRKAALESWKKNKTLIIDARVQELLSGPRPFPWE